MALATDSTVGCEENPLEKKEGNEEEKMALIRAIILSSVSFFREGANRSKDIISDMSFSFTADNMIGVSNQTKIKR